MNTKRYVLIIKFTDSSTLSNYFSRKQKAVKYKSIIDSTVLRAELLDNITSKIEVWK